MYAAVGVLEKGCYDMPKKVVISGQTFEEVGVGDQHTCARSTAGSVYCWGTNSAGQVAGDGQSNGAVYNEPSSVPLPKALHLSVGADHNCIVSDGNEVSCWGANGFGQSAPNTPGASATPTELVVSLDGPLQVAAGILETCIFDGSNQVVCFGGNEDIHGRDAGCGTLGPSAMTLDGAVKRVSVGEKQACAQFSDGTYQCWGSVPAGACTFGEGWCNATSPDGCVVAPDQGGEPTAAIASTSAHWCIADQEVVCSQNALLPSAPPVTKSLAELDLQEVRLLATSGTTVVCASDTYDVACWAPGLSAPLCNNGENTVIPMSFQ